jgi:hypothetical protein
MYDFKYKRWFFFRTVKNCKAHNYKQDIDRMDVFQDSRILSIPKWSECTLVLGKDFMLFEKEQMRREKGDI